MLFHKSYFTKRTVPHACAIELHTDSGVVASLKREWWIIQQKSKENYKALKLRCSPLLFNWEVTCEQNHIEFEFIKCQPHATALLFLLPQRFTGTHLCLKLRLTRNLSAAGRTKSNGKYSDITGNRTSDFPTCSIGTQRTALPCGTGKFIQLN
jgi:hypothetical protein